MDNLMTKELGADARRIPRPGHPLTVLRAGKRLGRPLAAFGEPTAISLRELESQLWRWRVVVALVFAASLLVAHTRVEILPLGLVAISYLPAYVLLRVSGLRCPWFSLLLFALDLAAVTAAVCFSGGSQSVLAFMYVFPVAVMAVARSAWAATALASVALALHFVTIGPGVLVHRAPKDTVVLVVVLYVMALVVGRTHEAAGRYQVDLAKRLAVLHEDLVGLSDEGSIASLLSRSVAMGTELTGAAYGAVSIWDEEGKNIYFFTAGLDPTEVAHLGEPPSGSGLLGQVCGAPGPIRLSDAGSHLGSIPLPPGHPAIGSFLGVPIPSIGRWKGAYYLIDKGSSEAFSLADEQLGEMLAAYVAAAVVTRQLAASQREMHDSLLEMLVKISDAREHALVGHSERVRRYARAIGARVGLAGEELELVATAGLLHDIGKIGIPDGILGKPGPLDDEERSIMMTHAGIGASIVARAGPLAGLAPFVRHHHERFDGKGYPDGLAGEAIPLGARIVALADTLDAITGDRPYRARRSMPDAMAEVARCAGSQFDPELAALVPAVVEEEAAYRQAAAPCALPEHQATLAELHSAAQTARWRLFTRIAKEIDTLLDLPRVGQRIVSILCDDLPVSGVALNVLEPGGESLRLIAWEGDPARRPTSSVLERGVGLPWVALEDGKPLVVADVTAHPRYAGMLGRGPAAGVYLPLAAGGKTVGILNFLRPFPQSFGERDLAYLEAVATPVAELLLIAELHAEVEQAAMTDPLTKAGSRRYGLERLAASCAQAARNGRSFAVVLLDLDGFKGINDRYGHQAGDAVLSEAVRRLGRRVRAEDVLARYGGDEFLLVASETGTPEMPALVERLAAGSPDGCLLFEGRAVPLPGWSMGVAVCPEDGADATELLRVADRRLYANKHEKSGREGPANLQAS
jgi:diguanylate cyclase (GGDEF)-like protein/putative nucleotidyltransferase with HDIG domain